MVRAVPTRGFFRRESERVARRRIPDAVRAPKIEVPKTLDWYVWRIVNAEPKIATLQEIETHWSISDLSDAHLILDVREDLDRLRAAEIKRGQR